MATTTTTVSTGYGTSTTTTTTTVVRPDIYNDKGCSTGPQSCGNYSAVVKCLADLYAGIDFCQNVYILDPDGNPVDINRIDKIDIAVSNEFGCVVMTSDDGISVSSSQSTYYGDLFTITPDDFWDKERLYFDWHNIRVRDNDSNLDCPDCEKSIVLGYGGDETESACPEYGYIIFNPMYHSGDLYVELTPSESNEGHCIGTINGIPIDIKFGEKMPFVNVLKGTEESVISIMSYTANNEPNVAKLDMIKISCDKGYRNKGMISICYDGSSIPAVTGRLTAEIMLKFNEYDETEPGATKIINCVPLANVMKSNLIYEHEDDKQEKPEYVVGGVIYKYVDKLPNPGWNTMNTIYLIRPDNAPEGIYYEYITVKINNGGIYSYHWEKIGDTNYDINAIQHGDKSVDIVLTDHEDDTDKILLKHKDMEDGHGSMIEFDADGDSTIVARVTHIDGGLL